MTDIANLLSFKGRLSRAEFRIIFAVAAIAKFAFARAILTFYREDLVASLAALMARALSPQGAGDLTARGISPAIALTIGAGVALWGWIVVAAHVRRLHDLGWSGWTCAAAPALALGGIALGLALARTGAPHYATVALVGGLGASSLCSLAILGVCLIRNGAEAPDLLGTARLVPGPAAEAPRAATLADDDNCRLVSYRAPQHRTAAFGRRRAA